MTANNPQPTASAAPAPFDGRLLGISVLSVTACILLVGLVLLIARAPEPAYAIGQSDRGGDYIMLTQQVSTSTEAVIVVDAAAQRMIIYGFDYNKKILEIVQQVPLDRLPGPGQRGVEEGGNR